MNIFKKLFSKIKKAFIKTPTEDANVEIPVENAEACGNTPADSIHKEAIKYEYDDFEYCTKNELYKFLKDNNVRGIYKLTKPELKELSVKVFSEKEEIYRELRAMGFFDMPKSAQKSLLQILSERIKLQKLNDKNA